MGSSVSTPEDADKGVTHGELGGVMTAAETKFDQLQENMARIEHKVDGIPAKIDSFAEKLDNVQAQLSEHEGAMRDLEDAQDKQLELSAQMIEGVKIAMQTGETQLVQMRKFPRRVRSDRGQRPAVVPAAPAEAASVEADRALD